jgi:hypothetical protein
MLAGLPLDSTVDVAAAQGMLDLLDGNYRLAEDRLRRVVYSPADSLVRRFAYYGLEAILTSEERYAALESLEIRARHDGLATDSTSYLAAQVMSRLGPMEIRVHTSSTQLPMIRTIANCPAAPVRVNGGREENFWFDTGASMSVVSEAVAQRFNVRMLSTAEGAAGTSTERKVKFRFGVIDSLLMGNILIRNVPVAVMKGNDLNLGVPFLNIPGIIGWPVIARFRTTFDNPARRVVFEPPAPVPEGRRNLVFAGVPVVEVAFDHAGPLHFLFDTGANGSMLTQAGLERLSEAPAFASAPGCIGGAGGGDAKSLKVTPASTLTLDRQSVYPLNIQLHELPVQEVPIVIDGLVGEDVLANFAVTIDARNGLVTVSK